MSNKFVARKGLVALQDSEITGSLNITQNIVAGGTIQASFAEGTSTAISGAFDSVSSSLAQRVTPLETSVSSLNSASSSYLLNTSDTLVGDLTVTGTITAQEFHTEFVSASIIYESGSTKFGNSSDDTHTFTGTGSFDRVGIGTTTPSTELTVVGNIKAGYESATGLILGLTPSSVGIPNNNVNAFILWGDYATFGGNNGDLLYIPRTSTTGEHRFYTANTGLASEKMRITYDGKVGIGTTSPGQKLHVDGNVLFNGGTGASTFNDVNIGGTSGWSNNEAHRINFVYGSASSPINFQTIESHYDGLTSRLRFRNLFNDNNPKTDIAMTLMGNGNVGIGTDSPLNQFAVVKSNTYGYYNRTEPLAVFQGVLPTLLVAHDGNANNEYAEIKLGNNQADYYPYSAYIRGVQGAGVDRYKLEFGTSNYAAAATRMVIDFNGNVGIGTTLPSQLLTLGGASSVQMTLSSSTTTGSSEIYFGDSDAAYRGYIGYQHNGDYLEFHSAATHRMRINSLGNVIIGPSSTVDYGSIMSIAGNVHLTDGANRYLYIGSITNYNYRLRTDGDDFAITEAGVTDRLRYSYTNVRWTMTGGLTITGSLSKGSGSFKIDHPLPSKKDTNYLVHSFIEGPQADNIYRGKIQLTNGRATVNLDQAARITEGTFVLLNGNIQCFTSNESGWTAVKGVVEGNILTIEAQDLNSTDTISWLVIGERIDQHMIDTDWTDENGKVITEPLK